MSLLNNDVIIHIFSYVPLKQYKINKEIHNQYKNYAKQNLIKIIKLLKHVVFLKKLCKNELILKRNHNFTKNTLIKFALINYEINVLYGLPNIIVGSFNLPTHLLDILPYDNQGYRRNKYNIYKFLKQNDIETIMMYLSIFY
jgi:hypothetical protein